MEYFDEFVESARMVCMEKLSVVHERKGPSAVIKE